MPLHAVILAGGSGARFWPLSTGDRPKHLLRLLGHRTLVEETVARLRGLVPPSRTWVVTSRTHAPEVRRLLPSLPRHSVLAEPRPRNTAAAIALAASRIWNRDPEGVMVVLPADHWIPDGPGFRRTLAAAAERADAAGTIVLVGVRPGHPATGYGYIAPGRVAAKVRGVPVRRVRGFTEKPDLARARRLVRSGRLWNAGMFAARAEAILAEVRRHIPRLHSALVASGAATGSAAALVRAYARVPAVSVDFGVLEKSDRVEVVPASFRWDDLGSFAALLRHLPKDARGNAARGALAALDARRVLAVGPPGHLTAVLGVVGLAVVTVPGATLVVPLDRCEEVRRIAARL